MIIDWFTDDPYDPPILYERTRGADGVLHERYIMHDDDDYVVPYCWVCLLYTSPSPRDRQKCRMPSSA